MPTRKFPVALMKELASEGCVYDENDNQVLDKIKDKIVENGRWTITHEIIFKSLDDEKFYSSYYNVGSTEYQDEYPYDYEGPLIECTEVKQVEKIVKVWEKV